MVAVMRGEVRWSRGWRALGHEPDGNHPVLVIGSRPFDNESAVLVVPVTTPVAERTNWWEVNLYGTNSCALAPGLRTIAVRDIRPSGVGIATLDDMTQVWYVLDLLLQGFGAPAAGHRYNPGTVWQLLRHNSGAPAGQALILRHNPGNGVAMAMMVGANRPGLASLAVPVESDPALSGEWVLSGYVRPLSVTHRLGSYIGSVSDTELNDAVARLLALMTPPVLPNAALPYPSP